MTSYTLSLFGFTILSLDVMQYELVEDKDESDAAKIEGGSAHNFERDFSPLSPTAHHEWEWEDKKRFGF